MWSLKPWSVKTDQNSILSSRLTVIKGSEQQSLEAGSRLKVLAIACHLVIYVGGKKWNKSRRFLIE